MGVRWPGAAQAAGRRGCRVATRGPDAARRSSSTSTETMDKVPILNKLAPPPETGRDSPGAPSSMRAGDRQPPSFLVASTRDRTQTLEIICFLRVTLLELTDAM